MSDSSTRLPESEDHPLLQVENLSMHFPIHGGVLKRQTGTVQAVTDVDLTIAEGETLGIVGESGCGKSTLARAILQLYTPTAGKVIFDGKNLAQCDKRQLRNVRQDMQMIFQDPSESLNSRHSIGEILSEPMAIHNIGDHASRQQRVRELLDQVGLPVSYVGRYPHELSGGQRQRVGIARAIALKPKLVICDEAVSALDVSVQSQVINLLVDLQRELGLAYLFIAHDLAAVKHISDRIAVMYLGKIVEVADATALYHQPQHPYTRALTSAIPIADPTRKKARIVLQGEVPSPSAPPSGCHFHTRCAYIQDRCRKESPSLRQWRDGEVACHFAESIPQR